jgi:hypothetical protein
MATRVMFILQFSVSFWVFPAVKGGVLRMASFETLFVSTSLLSLKVESGKWDIHNHKQVLNSFTMPVLDSLNNFRSAMAMNARRSTIV